MDASEAAPEGQAPEQAAHTSFSSAGDRPRRLLLLFSVFAIGGCGLLYELAAGAVASYLIGNSVTHYSLVIGTFLASMGLGAWLTQWVRERLLSVFLRVQLTVGVFGGFSGLMMFAAFAHTEEITLVVLGCAAVIGTLVGMEIPLIIRLLRRETVLRVNLAEVLSADYLGALAASIAFPFLVLPLLGLVRAALAAGLLNVAVGTLGTLLFWQELVERKRLAVWNACAWVLLLMGVAISGRATSWLEDRLYQDEIVYAETTPYNRIVVTRWKQDYRLHLSGHLQFSSRDEYRYHEALVLPAVGAALADGSNPEPLDVLILGGGDGLAVRQVLACINPRRIDLVDIDRRVVELFREHPVFRRLNDGALSDRRVTTHYEDAMVFLRETDRRYDVVMMDLPDPSTVETNKLYTRVFFGLALRRLTDRGVLVTQASSPFYAQRAFWCIVRTLETALARMPNRSPQGTGARRVIPYHIYVPSFGDWGFVLVTAESAMERGFRLPEDARFLTRDVFRKARVFPPDRDRVPTEINRLDDPVLVRYHARDWSRWNE